MNRSETIIKVRHGINGFKYSACDKHGCFIRNFDRLADIRNHWLRGIQRGKIILIRELDQMPDMSEIEETKKLLESILQSHVKK